LVDLPPIEPLPPIENPLEMTQNHEDWVRGREDFKIEYEKMQRLHQIESFQVSVNILQQLYILIFRVFMR
jgi:hypothetical protein